MYKEIEFAVRRGEDVLEGLGVEELEWLRGVYDEVDWRVYVVAFVGIFGILAGIARYSGEYWSWIEVGLVMWDVGILVMVYISRRSRRRVMSWVLGVDRGIGVIFCAGEGLRSYEVMAGIDVMDRWKSGRWGEYLEWRLGQRFPGVCRSGRWLGGRGVFVVLKREGCEGEGVPRWARWFAGIGSREWIEVEMESAPDAWMKYEEPGILWTLRAVERGITGVVVGGIFPRLSKGAREVMVEALGEYYRSRL